METNDILNDSLKRIADALEQLSPSVQTETDLKGGTAFIWQADALRLKLASSVSRMDLALLKGINQAKDILLKNTVGLRVLTQEKIIHFLHLYSGYSG